MRLVNFLEPAQNSSVGKEFAYQNLGGSLVFQYMRNTG